MLFYQAIVGKADHVGLVLHLLKALTHHAVRGVLNRVRMVNHHPIKYLQLSIRELRPRPFHTKLPRLKGMEHTIFAPIRRNTVRTVDSSGLPVCLPRIDDEGQRSTVTTGEITTEVEHFPSDLAEVSVLPSHHALTAGSTIPTYAGHGTEGNYPDIRVLNHLFHVMAHNPFMGKEMDRLEPILYNLISRLLIRLEVVGVLIQRISHVSGHVEPNHLRQRWIKVRNRLRRLSRCGRWNRRFRGVNNGCRRAVVIVVIAGTTESRSKQATN
jgi:hypothetical protein